MSTEVLAVEQCVASVMEYRSLSEIEALIDGFETGTLPRSEWTHAAHLTVALWYLTRVSGREATARIRNGIKRFNAAKGIVTTPTSGYHETITLFWICIVSRYLLAADAGDSLVELVNGLLARYTNSHLPFAYYSRDLLMSPRARASWIEPDLKAFD
jgi:hypothetical protein